MAPEVILAMDEGQYDGKVCKGKNFLQLLFHLHVQYLVMHNVQFSSANLILITFVRWMSGP